MAKRAKKRRNKRYLLTAVALSTGTLLSGCGSAQDEEPRDETTNGVEGEPLPLPANPKGAVYDQGTAAPDPEPTEEVEEVEEEPTEEVVEEVAEPEPTEVERPRPEPVPPRPLPLPANPKGAHYDNGPFAPGQSPTDVED